MQKGQVKWFNQTKGFGFVESEGKDYFIHFKEIMGNGLKSLNPGDRVSFEPSMSAKGAIAKKLSVLG